jgi:hypothetical protein
MAVPSKKMQEQVVALLDTMSFAEIKTTHPELSAAVDYLRGDASKIRDGGPVAAPSRLTRNSKLRRSASHDY